MNKRELDILKLEQDFRDTLENDIIQKENKNEKIKDIIYTGTTGDGEKLFLVKVEESKVDQNGKEYKKEKVVYYLDNKSIAGGIQDNEIIFSEKFMKEQEKKSDEIRKMVENTSEKEMEENSLENLEKQEVNEVKEAIQDDKEEDKKDTKAPKKLSNKQAEKIKVNGIQKIDLSKKIDGKETLGKRLDLENYNSIYVVYSDKIDEIDKNSNINNTTYSLVGMTNDGQAKLLNDEFEIDNTVGNSATRNQTKIKADNTATRDNRDSSVYRRKTNGASIGCENNLGRVDMYFYQKTAEENENIGIQIETSQTPVIPIETREIMNKNKGIYQKDKVQDEIERHTDEECNPDDRRDFDGNEETSTHLHEDDIDGYVLEILNYENEYGEESIKEIFTQREIKERLLREIENNKQLSIDQIVENVKEDMNMDAMNFIREHDKK